MKKIKLTLSLVLTFSAVLSFAQVGPDASQSVDLMYGTRLLKTNAISNYNTLNNYSFGNHLQFIGISQSGINREQGKKGSFFQTGYYAQVIPHKVEIYDTITAKVNGFIYHVGIATANLTGNSDMFFALLTVGFSTGRLRIKSGDELRQKNPFFAPSLTLQPKLRLGKLVLSITGEYAIDVSKKTWKKTTFAEDGQIELAPFDWSGAALYFGIGMSLN